MNYDERMKYGVGGPRYTGGLADENGDPLVFVDYAPDEGLKQIHSAARKDRLRNRALHVALIALQVVFIFYAVSQVYVLTEFGIGWEWLSHHLALGRTGVSEYSLAPLWALTRVALSGIAALALWYPIDRTRPRSWS